jgi:hypothetical protein
MLSEVQLEQFVRDGFVRIDHAFPRALAEQGRAVLWQAMGLQPDEPERWTKPVVRLGMFPGPPFADAANTAALHSAFDQLVGKGRWQPCMSLGTFPVRFPSKEDPGDAGWHIDVSFGFEADPNDFLSWRANVRSKGRALLMLFLFSDVGDDDAPTKLRVGSHRPIARALAPAGEAGLTLRELLPVFPSTEQCAEALATGEAGTVYLCHPLLVHSAQPHRGSRPRFLAQPPLLPREPEDTGAPPNLVEQAIAHALREAPTR